MSTRAIVPTLALALAAAAAADQVQIGASKDNTLYEDAAGALSNGVGPYLFAGRTGNFAGGAVRRAAVAFDVASAVPAGATVTGATLTLHMSKSPMFNPDQTFTLHRLLADWGEGTSDSGQVPGGAGEPSTAGDATWIHTFFPGSFWASTGGDFVAAASGSTVVGTPIASYTWASTPQMVADVQSWLDDPATNFGWLVRGNEATLQTARRFDSRENTNAAFQPLLRVTFDAPPDCPGDTNGDGMVDIDDIVNVVLDFGTDGSMNGGDVNGDGMVDIDDIVFVVLNFGATCP